MDGVAQEYGEELEVTILDATNPVNKRRIQELGFHSHGMVILDSRGKIRIKMDGHNLSEKSIRQAVKRVMEQAS